MSHFVKTREENVVQWSITGDDDNNELQRSHPIHFYFLHGLLSLGLLHLPPFEPGSRWRGRLGFTHGLPNVYFPTLLSSCFLLWTFFQLKVLESVEGLFITKKLVAGHFIVDFLRLRAIFLRHVTCEISYLVHLL